MSIWSTLEIESTDDISAIKKAYAKLLKIHHPEDDPEGYQRLREAYDQAIKSAKQMKDKPLVQLEEMDGHDREPIISPWIDSNAEIATTVIAEHPVYSFMERIEALYDDFFARMESENWEELLRSDVIWDVQYAAALQDQLIEFLLYHYYFPHSIWVLLDNVFRFSEQKEDLESEYGEENVQFLLERISGLKGMRYDVFEKDNHFDFETYFYLREEVQRQLIANELKAVDEVLTRAYSMYQKDPELLRMQGIYYLRTENQERALQSFSDVLLIDADDPDALLYRARINYNRSQFDTAIKDCEHLLSIQPEHMDAMLMMTKCLAKIGELEKAEDKAKEAREIDLNRVEFASYINELFVRNGRKEEKQKLTKKHIMSYILYYTFMFLRRTWIYVVLFIITMVTRLPLQYFFLLPIIWELRKFCRLKIKA